MKIFLKSTGLICYFFAAQVITTAGVFCMKAVNNPAWFREVLTYYLGGNMDMFMEAYQTILFPTLIMTDVLIILPFAVYAFRHDIRFTKKEGTRTYFDTMMLAVALNGIISFTISILPKNMTETYDSLIASAMGTDFFTVLLVTGILSPFAEEFLFRFGLINVLEKRGKEFAVIVSALLFGIAHLNLIQGIYGFLMGLILGVLYIRNKNMIQNILFHVTVNTTSILYEYMPDKIKVTGIMLVCFAILYTCWYLSIIYFHHKRMKRRII